MTTPDSAKPTEHLVLLVDDNHTHQYSLGRHLNECGFSVVQAHSGEETMQALAKQKPDAILLDIHLPDETGFDTCRRIKADPTTAGIPIIFHSATYDAQSARVRAADLGAASFLTYPIDIEHLMMVIRGAIAQAKRSS